MGRGESCLGSGIGIVSQQFTTAAEPVPPDAVVLDSAGQANYDQFIAGRRQQHTQASPRSDNILILFFSTQSELPAHIQHREDPALKPFQPNQKISSRFEPPSHKRL